MRKSLINVINDCFKNKQYINHTVSNGITLNIMFNSKKETLCIDLLCLGMKQNIELNKSLELNFHDVDKIVDNIIVNINRRVIKVKKEIALYEEKL